MNNVASILILVFLSITFIQSSYEKLFYWKDTVVWLKEHFAKTHIKNYVPPMLFLILILELISSILCVVGAIQLIMNDGREYGFYGAIFSCITLLIMLFGQRLARDYEGAKTIAIYFTPAVIVVHWLN